MARGGIAPQRGEQLEAEAHVPGPAIGSVEAHREGTEIARPAAGQGGPGRREGLVQAQGDPVVLVQGLVDRQAEARQRGLRLQAVADLAGEPQSGQSPAHLEGAGQGVAAWRQLVVQGVGEADAQGVDRQARRDVVGVDAGPGLVVLQDHAEGQLQRGAHRDGTGEIDLVAELQRIAGGAEGVAGEPVEPDARGFDGDLVDRRPDVEVDQAAALQGVL